MYFNHIILCVQLCFVFYVRNLNFKMICFHLRTAHNCQFYDINTYFVNLTQATERNPIVFDLRLQLFFFKRNLLYFFNRCPSTTLIISFLKFVKKYCDIFCVVHRFR